MMEVEVLAMVEVETVTMVEVEVLAIVLEMVEETLEVEDIGVMIIS